jgi:hypothetical protein
MASCLLVDTCLIAADGMAIRGAFGFVMVERSCLEEERANLNMSIVKGCEVEGMVKRR